MTFSEKLRIVITKGRLRHSRRSHSLRKESMALNTNVRAAIAGAVGLVAGVALIASLYLQQRRKTGSKDSPKGNLVDCYNCYFRPGILSHRTIALHFAVILKPVSTAHRPFNSVVVSSGRAAYMITTTSTCALDR